MKIFISGPMRGIKDFNSKAFNEAEKILRGLGYDVFNPSWMLFSSGFTTDDILSIDLAALNKCDAICQLDGWENSSGARAEYVVAEKTGKIIGSLDYFINNKNEESNFRKYYVGYIIQNSDNLIYTKYSEKFATFNDATISIEYIKKTSEDNIISIWVEEFINSSNKNIVYHEVVFDNNVKEKI